MNALVAVKSKRQHQVQFGEAASGRLSALAAHEGAEASQSESRLAMDPVGHCHMLRGRSVDRCYGLSWG